MKNKIKMTKAVLINADDWEGLYINGILKEEGHTLNEGRERITHFLELAKQHDFELGKLGFYDLDSDAIAQVEEDGSLPNKLSDIITFE